MKRIALTTAALIALTTASNAYVIHLGKTLSSSPIFAGEPANSGGTTNLSGPFFSEGWNFSSMVIAKGTSKGVYVDPLGYSGNYGVVLGGGNSEEVMKSSKPFTSIDIEVGSIDAYNTFAFNGGVSILGSDIAKEFGFCTASNCAHATALLEITGLPASTQLILTDREQGNSLEFIPMGLTNGSLSALSSVNSVGGIPEASTWMMMLFGFTALGFVGRRKLARSAF